MSTAAILALLAALLFGTGTALQAHAAADRPLMRLLGRPLWWAGTMLDWLGAGVHLVALHFGPLALVQPLTTTAIIFAVPVAALLGRRRPSRRQLLAAVETSAGLGLLAGFLGRGLVHSTPSATTAVVVPLVLVVVLAAAVHQSSRLRNRRTQALLLGAAAGSAYGLSDALARTVQVTRLVALGSPLWVVMVAGLVVVGGAGLLLTQLALQRAPLSSSLPAQDFLALVVSIGLGAVLLGETPPSDPLHLVVGAVALVLVGHGIRTLAGRPDSSAGHPHGVTSSVRTTRSPTESRARSACSSEQISSRVPTARDTTTVSLSSQSAIRTGTGWSEDVPAST